VVSQIHYVIARKDHRHHALFASIPTASERLRVAIAGDPEHGVASIGERLDAFEGWLTSDALVVRFEDLVGPAGGGDAEAQARTVRAIEDHLGIAVPDERFRAICASLPDLPAGLRTAMARVVRRRTRRAAAVGGR
jgi:hypothetical protein